MVFGMGFTALGLGGEVMGIVIVSIILEACPSKFFKEKFWRENKNKLVIVASQEKTISRNL